VFTFGHYINITFQPAYVSQIVVYSDLTGPCKHLYHERCL